MNDDNARTTSELLVAIINNDIATASSLISSGGLNLNDRPCHLHMAIAFGRLEIMTLLLDAGADIDLCDDDSYTTCQYAIRYNHFDALKLLVERGANVNLKASNKSLLVTAAHCHRSDQFLNYLLDAGAPLDN